MAVREFIKTAINDMVESIMYDVEVLTGIDQPTFGIPFGQKPQHVYMILRTKLADFQAKYLASDVSITLQCIGLYQLSEAVVDLCGIFIAGWNWNAVAGKFGAALITLAKMVWYAESSVLMDRLTRLKGVPLGGQRHGSPETKYVSYMVSTLEEVSPGVVRNFIESADHVFESSKHGEAILQILGCDHPLRKKPPWWPTQDSHSWFCCSMGGNKCDWWWVQDQCVRERSGGSSVSSSCNWAAELGGWGHVNDDNKLKHFFLLLTDPEGPQEGVYKSCLSTSAIQDQPWTASHSKRCAMCHPPPCHMVENGKIRVVTSTDPDILKKWKEMNIQKRTFVTQIMWVLDILVNIYGRGNYVEVSNKVSQAFLNKGLREPYFITGAAKVDIPEQVESQFYCFSKNMGPVMERKRARAEVSDTLRDFVNRFTVSDELQEALVGTSEALAREGEKEGEEEGQGQT